MSLKKTVILFNVLIVFSMGFGQSRPKIGLTLSGGGAKGFAGLTFQR